MVHKGEIALEEVQHSVCPLLGVTAATAAWAVLGAAPD